MSHRSDRHGRGWMGATAVSPFESSTFVPLFASEATTTALDGGPVRTLTAVAGAWVDESDPATNLRFYSSEARPNLPQRVVMYAAID